MTPLQRAASVSPRIFLALLVALSALTPAGCHLGRSAASNGAFTITSIDNTSVFRPSFITAAYFPIDPNSADIYLSDIPAQRLTDTKDPLDTATGSIVHIHFFLVPSAGDTPIDNTACNVTIRHLVLAGKTEAGRRAIGLYGGGGFVDPSGTIGSESIGGGIEAATHRLIRSTHGFHDPLGSGSISGRFSAPRNDALVKAIAGRIDDLLLRLPPPAAKSLDEDVEIKNTLKAKATPDAPKPDTPKPSAPKPTPK